MRNRYAVRGDVAAIEAPDPPGRRGVVAIDGADLPIAAAESAWPVTSAGRALGSRGHPLHQLILGVTDPAIVVLHRKGRFLACRRRNLIPRQPVAGDAWDRPAPAHGGALRAAQPGLPREAVPRAAARGRACPRPSVGQPRGGRRRGRDARRPSRACLAAAPCVEST